MTDEVTAEPEKGFVFATTGESYTILARRAARSLRAVMPGAAIDLFTDQAVDDVIFDKIHGLDHNGHRPKMEALRRSRFARTIYLDADVMVLTDISEVFDLLDGYDLAAALGGNRSQQMVPPDDGLPRAFPVVNSGVIAARSSPRLAAFLTEWEDEVARTKSRLDQPALRRRLYETDLRFIPLPIEYNLKNIKTIDVWLLINGAPRILHQAALHKGPPGDPMMPYSLDELLSVPRATHVRDLLETDWSLGGTPHAISTPTDRLRLQLKRQQGGAGKATRRLRRLMERLRAGLLRRSR